MRRELAEQKQIIKQILATQEAQKAASAKVEAKVEEQAKVVAQSSGGGAAQAIASAMPNVSLYGVLDGGFERITNIGTGKSSLTRMPNITGSIPSRVGIRAGKEFAPGYRAIATAEIGFNFDDGTLGQSNTTTTGARIFGRQLFAGVDTPYGAFTIGRQYSMLMYALGDADLLTDQQFDLVIANINRNILLNDIPVYSTVIKSKGLLTLSGFYLEDLPIINETTEKCGLQFIRNLCVNNWCTCLYQKV
ncbi:MAG: porin [Betaproteobacteria bacterium]